MDARVLAGREDVFRAIACAVVPEAGSLDEAGWREVEATVEQALAPRPPAIRRQLRTFMGLIELLPLLRHGRRFSHADLGTRTRVLRGLEHSPLRLLRKGFWGLRTLVLMGYYTRTATLREIGYGALAGGWGARASPPELP